MESKQEYVNRVFNEARARGLCKNQKEFAQLLGMDQSTISNALQGREKYLTDSLVRRVRAWDEQVLNAYRPAPGTDTRPDLVIPAATIDLYTSMAKSIDRLTALVERMQPGASAFAGVPDYAPKNFRTDGK